MSLTKKIGTASTSYIYSNNRLSSTSGGETATYSYNGYGSLTGMTKNGIAYNLVYDYLNNLKGYKSGSTSLADFAYDGDGMRVIKTAGGKTVVYHYDREGKVISETDSAGNLIADYIYLNGKLVAKKAPSAVYFYHTDPAGTPMAMTNMSRSVVWRADYKPFGEEQSISGTIENNEKFTGKEKDKETGLYYFGARYMRPEIGRFIVVDPVGPVSSQTGKANEKLLLNPQKLNRYAYAGNNPYRYIDPDGRTWLEFVKSSNTLFVHPGTMETQGPPQAFPAGNNTTNPTGDPNRLGSNGPAPLGTFPVQDPVNTEGRQEYGPYFFPVGDVGSNGERLDIARQRGIGIHGGRSGPESRTHGCIRVSDETDITLYEIHQADPITSITIREREE